MTWADVRLRLRALFLGARAERELRDELEFHLEMQSRKYVAAGLGWADARRRARADFGSLELAKEDSRDVRGLRFLETLGQDLRYALRGFRRTPTFALTVVLTIALALGLNTTVFTIFNAYVLRPLPVRDPFSLYDLHWTDRAGQWRWFSWDRYQALRRDSSAVSESFAFRSLFDRGNGQPTFGLLVTGDYFRMLGVGAAIGRVLQPADAESPGAAPIVVLSHDAWMSRFGGDSAVVGRTMLFHGRALEIVGVARAGFGGLRDSPPDFWAPATMINELDRRSDAFGPAQPELFLVAVRLKAGLSASSAREKLLNWARAITGDLPGADRATGIVLLSDARATRLPPESVFLLAPIAVAFGLVLLIACANVSNMMLARGMARQREIGIRLSLGAGRGRLVRQLLMESALLAIPAAGAGFVISRGTVQYGEQLLRATVPADFAAYIRVVPLDPDVRVFAFMLIAAVSAALLFGLVPALQTTRGNVVEAARGDFDSELRPARLRQALIFTQVTACVVLLVCAGVLVRGVTSLANVDVGFRTHNIAQLEVTEEFRPQSVARLRAEPDVTAVAISFAAVLDGAFPSIPVSSAGGRRSALAWYDLVSPSFFELLEIPIIRGHNFSAEEERAQAPVAVVSQAAARLLWSNEDPIGQFVRLVPAAPAEIPRLIARYEKSQVIGVAGDIVIGNLLAAHARDEATIYFPTNERVPGTRVLARLRGNAAQVQHRIDADLAALGPDAAGQVHGLDDYLAGSVYPLRAAYWVSMALGLLALALTVTGIYGVLSYVVLQRTREIGIRMALGADSHRVVALVMSQSLRVASIGGVLGIALALAASRVFASRLVFVNTFDAFAYAGGALTVILACAGAAFVPARRAAHVDPANTLRYD